MRMKSMHAITSAKRSKLELCLRPTCKVYCFWRVIGETCRTGRSQNIGHAVELSRYQALYSSYAALRNRVKPAKHSKRKVLASIFEDMRTVLRDTELTTHSESVEYRVRFELSRECSVS